MAHKQLKSIIFTVFILFVPLYAYAIGVTWFWANPSQNGYPLNAVIWNGAKYIAVGDFGAVLTSPNGIDWALHPTDTSADLYAIAWNGSSFVAGGNGGTILTSHDGIKWNKIQSWTHTAISSLVWTSTHFIALTDQVYSSKNGQNWTQLSPMKLTNIIWTGTQYIGISEYKNIVTSPDGVDWTTQYESPDFSNSQLADLIWENNKIIVVGHDPDYNIQFLTSADGEEWIDQTLPFRGTPKEIIWNGAQYLVRSDSYHSTDPKNIYLSTDGINWEQQQTDNALARAANMIWADDQYLAVSGTKILSSADGISWINHNFRITSNTLYAIAWDGTTYISVGLAGTIIRSNDALTWEHQALPDNASVNLFDVIWGGGQFVAVGNGILTSPDGKTWTLQHHHLDIDPLTAVTWNGAIYVAVGGNGSILTSPNGVDWIYRKSGTSMSLTDVQWDGSRFIAAARNSKTLANAFLLFSENGIEWDLLDIGVYPATYRPTIESIISSGNKYIIAGTMGILTSDDSINWELSLFGGNYSSAIWTGNQFVVTGGDGGTYSYGNRFPFVTSHDGINWTTSTRIIPLHLKDMMWNGEKLVAVGNSGTIIIGEEVPDLTIESEITPDNVSIDERFLYTINVDNDSVITASNVTVTARLPISVEVRSLETTHGECSEQDQLLECSFDNIAIDDNPSITVHLTPTTISDFSITATVESPDTDANIFNQTTTANSVIRRPQLGISLFVENVEDNTILDATVLYQFDVYNNGAVNANNVHVIHELPVNLELTSLDTTQGICEINNKTIVCNLDTLGAKSNTTIKIHANLITAGSMEISATASARELEYNMSDNIMKTSLETKSIALSVSDNPNEKGGKGEISFWIIMILLSRIIFNYRKYYRHCFIR